MNAPDRMTRVNELLKREIATIIERDELGGASCLVSVTKVKTTPDLRHAEVMISIMGSDDAGQRKIIAKLQHRHAYIQKKIAKRVTLKYTPVLNFELDLNIADGDRVLAMLNELEHSGE